jgi:hypothetical protein
MKRFFLYLIFWITTLYGCTKDAYQSIVTKPAGCDSVLFTYDKDIRPLMIANCSGPYCHSGGNFNYNFLTYEVLAGRVKSGSLQERILLPDHDPLYMPKGGELSQCDLFTLITWIRQGFKKN